MLIAVVIAIVPSANAINPFTCYGYVYINDVITQPEKVVLKFPGQEIEADLYSDGYFIVDGSENVGVTGSFDVTMYGNTYTADETITIITDIFDYPMDLHVEIVNLPPNVPTLVSPSPSGKTGVGINADLTWSCSDPDGDPLTYDVYFENDDDTPDVLVSDDQSGTTYDPGTLDYSEDYYWQIVASDGEYSTSGPVWHFKTKDQETPSPPPGPGPGPSGGGSTNLVPNANAGGPYTGTVDVEITFDGSGSSDPNGDDLEYRWDFENDGTYDTGWSGSATATHTYSTAGDYKVTLQVKDEVGSTDTDTVNVAIGQFNIPPTDPDVSGPQTGDVDTNYDYTAVSTDADNDTIQYMIDWGDGTNTTTALVENGTEVTETHSWSSYGFKTVAVTAYDDQGGASGTTQYVVAIDVMWVKDIGYLIDTNSDGTYDSFYSNETGAETATEKQTDGTYYINSDEDAEWDWVYDPDTDTLTAFGAPSEPAEDYTWLYALIIVIILLLIIGGAAAGRKKKPKGKSGKPKNKK